MLRIFTQTRDSSNHNKKCFNGNKPMGGWIRKDKSVKRERQTLLWLFRIETGATRPYFVPLLALD